MNILAKKWAYTLAYSQQQYKTEIVADAMIMLDPPKGWQAQAVEDDGGDYDEEVSAEGEALAF